MTLDPMEPRVGTSSFGFNEWRDSFYPSKLPRKQMMPFYAKWFKVVEINHTFRQMPKASTLEAWAKQVPHDFQFASDEVSIEKREGKIILWETPKNLARAFELLTKFPDDFFSEGRHDTPPQERELL